MKWNKAHEIPALDRRNWLVLLFEDGRIQYNAAYDGEDFTLWDDENGVWSSAEKIVGRKMVGWMYQSEVNAYLRGLKDKED